MKKIILSGFLCLSLTVSAQKEYFSIIGKTFVEEHIVPDHITTSPLGGGKYRHEAGWQMQKDILE